MKKLLWKLLEVLKGPHRDCPTCHGLSSIDPTNGCGICKWCYGVSKVIEVKMDTLPIMTFNIKQSLRYNFKPLRDITVYELSCLLPYMMSECPFYQEDYDRLGWEVQRHLEKIES